ALTVREYLERGAATSREIQAATSLGQTAVSRQIRGMGGSVIRFRRDGALRYALTRTAFGGDDKLPLATVDAHGNTVLTAFVRPLAHGGFYIEPEPGMTRLLLGVDGTGLYDDLPYFLEDLRPQGFIGRQIASDLSSQGGGFPDDPRRWSSEHIGRYLISNGEDLPGNFKFGQQALSRVRRPLVTNEAANYPALADNVMKGDIAGSSAGGEHPKFTAYCGKRSSHVIVKFSPKGDDATARRWRDVLLTEFHATEALHAEGFPATEAKVIELDDRIFLESQRFDRSNEYGRISMVSLLSIDAEFVANQTNWLPSMHGLLSGVFQESCRLKLKIMPPFFPQPPVLVFLD
ncbi:MAG: phosphatidylinositol kinase, partial [Gammaproteobacteria bacterium]|nr:phosphatidylinositol kinase [Gammaproteobacteria bacterium]